MIEPILFDVMMVLRLQLCCALVAKVEACVHNVKGSWTKYLPLIEFIYINNFQTTIGMTLYKALYGHKCRSSLHWDEKGER